MHKETGFVKGFPLLFQSKNRSPKTKISKRLPIRCPAFLLDGKRLPGKYFKVRFESKPDHLVTIKAALSAAFLILLYSYVLDILERRITTIILVLQSLHSPGIP
jgi:hypothetical protein